MLALLELGVPHLDRSLVKLASLARTELLLDPLLALLGLIACLHCFSLVCLLGLLYVHCLFFFLCSAWLDRLRLARSLVELASLARTDLDLASRLLRRLSLVRLGRLSPPT